jgi:hypothetical protein
MHPSVMAFDHSSLNGFILNAWPCPVLGSLSCEFNTVKHAIIRRLITIPKFTENRWFLVSLLDNTTHVLYVQQKICGYL